MLDGTTLSAQRVESDPFGHERGAFTGADRRIIGRIESVPREGDRRGRRGNRSLAARKLGLGRNTVARMVKQRDG